ncbi:MAG: hypothetical protein IJM58_09405 [Muribaculaceae bacterium]|nr:hypothetical protein [Muribaculaceae bacterium]
MNTVNQIFNWSRFTAALRKEVVENWRTIVFTILGIYLLLTVIMILGNIIDSISDNIVSSLMNMVPQKTVFFMLAIALMVVASLSFRNLKSKNGRVALFTSPSSTLEKFLVNVLIYVVGSIVVFFACAQLADLTRIGILSLVGADDLIVPGPINFLSAINDTVTGIGSIEPVAKGMRWIFWLSLLATPGMYLLGSVLWPRLSLLKTFAASQILSIVVMIITITLTNVLIPEDEIVNWLKNIVESGTLTNWIAISLGVQAVLYWGLSWYLFKRKDVVSLKWWK